MTTFHFELVSPEKLLFSGQTVQVDLPGSEGDFGVLAGHAPIVAMLRAGVVTIHLDRDISRIALRQGLAEFAFDKLTVLTEHAVPVEDIDPAMLALAIKDAEEDLADATDDVTRGDAARRIEQLALLQSARAGDHGK